MIPTVGGLFSGIGGFTLAFERAGYRVTWECEANRDARRVLAHHWPDVPCYPDVRALSGGAVEPVDVLTAGFPCQDLSIAGKRGGLEAARSGLFFEIPRVVREMRRATDGRCPAIVILENVPGLLSSNAGRDMAVVLWGLGQCGPLDLGWRVLDAQYFGVAQRRARVFLVADFRGQRAAAILALTESSPRHPPTRGETRTRVTCGATGGPNGTGRYSADVTGTLHTQGVETGQGDHAGLYDVEAGVPNALNLDRADTLSVGANQTTGFVGEAVLARAVGTRYRLRPEGCDASEDGTGRGKPPVIQTTGYQGDRIIGEGGPWPALPAGGGNNGGGAGALAFYSTRDGGSTDACAPLLTIGTGLDIPSPPAVSAMQVRRLTPRECCRLQGFPDDWLDGIGLADTAKYRLLGNAVCVNVVEWLARRAMADREVSA